METYKYFLHDLVSLLKELLEESDNVDEYDKGRIMGLYEVLDLIKSQSIAFNIPLSELNLQDYPLEKFLK